MGLTKAELLLYVGAVCICVSLLVSGISEMRKLQ